MSYIALARQWRPRTFSQLVGQAPVTKALINALNRQQLHHAYLFSGTRGVGKTSIARLLAKALNCEAGISATPCLQCDVCTAIEQGRFLDLIEIDGASKTRVEDTRELLDNVPYAPSHGRFKIYLIDEVHMFSHHSFNALLKTLEEPPEHVKFLLATTDPQKLPVTILSRCLQFHLKPLSSELIQTQLIQILEAESYAFDKEALQLIAQAAHGSMRDALSILDQVIAYSEQPLSTSDVKTILGYTQRDYAIELLQALADNSPAMLLKLSKALLLEGGNVHYVLDEMLKHLHQISIMQTVPDHPELLPDMPEALLHISKQWSPEDTQLFYQIGIKGREDIDLAPSAPIGFEMTVLRMHTFKPNEHQDYPQPLPKASNHQEPVTRAQTEEDWSNLLPKLQLNGLALSAAEQAELASKTGNTITLRTTNAHQSLFTTAVTARIEKALSAYFKDTITLQLDTQPMVEHSPAQKKRKSSENQQEKALSALQTDPFFQQLQTEFSADLVKNSIETCQNDL